jgi:hypothetical protein
MGNEEEEKFLNELEIVECENPTLLFEQQTNLKKVDKTRSYESRSFPLFSRIG